VGENFTSMFFQGRRAGGYLSLLAWSVHLSRSYAGGLCAVDLNGMREVGPATRQAADARDLGSKGT
jgi:hypothetical protein